MIDHTNYSKDYIEEVELIWQSQQQRKYFKDDAVDNFILIREKTVALLNHKFIQRSS